MARYWANNGEADERGRFCLVIDRENGTNPIRTYGTSKEEVLEKVANTLEHAEREIDRLRTRPTQPAPPAPQPPAPTRRTVTASDIAQATVDLSNPAKAADAIDTLLLSRGVDTQAMRQEQEIRRVARLCADWYALQEDARLADPRNQSRIVDKATLLAGARSRITAETLDQAYSILDRANDLFDAPNNNHQNQPAPPVETPESRTVARPRGAPATSYNRHRLTLGTTPSATGKQFYTQEQIRAMNSDEFMQKIIQVPQVLAWYEREYGTAKTA